MARVEYTYKIRYAGEETIANMSLIHYGAREFKPGMVKPIVNEGWVKPKGGLWTSPVQSEWGWKDWCEAEEFRWTSLNVSFELKLSQDARLCVIDNAYDLRCLPMVSVGYMDRCYPDFEKIAKEADAIWLTEAGQRETRFCRFEDGVSNGINTDLYGWDCESVLILNPNKIILL